MTEQVRQAGRLKPNKHQSCLQIKPRRDSSSQRDSVAMTTQIIEQKGQEQKELFLQKKSSKTTALSQTRSLPILKPLFCLQILLRLQITSLTQVLHTEKNKSVYNRQSSLVIYRLYCKSKSSP